MQSFTYSMLLDPENKDPFYEKFLLQYSFFSSSNFILYHLADTASEEEIFELFMKPHGCVDDYKRKAMGMAAMMLEDNSPQKNELRGLYLDRLLLDMVKKKISSKQALCSIININEFVMLYATFEGAMKSLFLQKGILDESASLKEKNVIILLENCLGSQKADFLNILKSRSPIPTFNALNEFWLFFTLFRHLFFHSCGNITKKWLTQYSKRKDSLMTALNSSDNIVEIGMIFDTIENLDLIEEQLFYAQDRFVNIFRNYIVRVVESIFILNKDIH